MAFPAVSPLCSTRYVWLALPPGSQWLLPDAASTELRPSQPVHSVTPFPALATRTATSVVPAEAEFPLALRRLGRAAAGQGGAVVDVRRTARVAGWCAAFEAAARVHLITHILRVRSIHSSAGGAWQMGNGESVLERTKPEKMILTSGGMLSKVNAAAAEAVT